MAVDYRKILIAYINHVGSVEGVDFLGDDQSTFVAGLSDEENVELAKARDATSPEEGGRHAVSRYYDIHGEPLK